MMPLYSKIMYVEPQRHYVGYKISRIEKRVARNSQFEVREDVRIYFEEICKCRMHILEVEIRRIGI